MNVNFDIGKPFKCPLCGKRVMKNDTHAIMTSGGRICLECALPAKEETRRVNGKKATIKQFDL